MTRVYYTVLANDGCPQSKELPTLREARRELKSIIEEDKKEFDINPGEIDYYIEKCIETDDTIYSEIVR